VTDELRELIEAMKRERGVLRIQDPAAFADKLETEIAKGEQHLDRLTQQALAISELLRREGIGPCTLPEGVVELINRTPCAATDPSKR
jgi:hypothetical protein